MELDQAIAVLDEAAITQTEIQRTAWRVVRSAARRGRRISTTTLPAIGEAAQHAAAARESANRVLDALGGVSAGRETDGGGDDHDER